MANNESDHDRLIRIDENTQRTVTHLEKRWHGGNYLCRQLDSKTYILT